MTPPRRYCEEHEGWAKARSAQANRLYDTGERDPEVVEFYHSAEWRALRETVLARDAYLCQPCLRAQRITRADTVHHVVPVKADWSRRMDPANLESVCRACHAQERRREAAAVLGKSTRG